MKTDSYRKWTAPICADSTKTDTMVDKIKF